MRQFFSFIQKEFYHIFRDTRTILMLLAMPMVQLILFGFAITTEINNTPFVVIDHSQSLESRQLIEKISSSSYFSLQQVVYTTEAINEAFQAGSAKLGMVIPADFAANLQRSGEPARLQLLVDVSDPNEGTTVAGYAQQIIQDYQQSVLGKRSIPYAINTEVKMLYNPQLKSAYNFVPGIMGFILMLICAMMTSISIVREKEQGTMEILLVSPMRPTTVVLAKAVPYLAIAMLDVIGILLLSVFVLQVPIAGNILLILALSFLFTLSALSLGMLISSITATQQAAMLISAVGLLLPTLLLSGLMYPIENMPMPLQIVSNLIPAKWFITAIKNLMIKGLGFSYILKEFVILSLMTVSLLTLSIKRFKNRL